jgi:hypothetical protein
MAGGGRTYYATGTGRFSTGQEIRTDAAGIRTATRKGELRVLTSFGTTQANPKGSLSKEELLEVLRSGDRIKFGDGTTVKVTADNKLAVVNRLVSEGQRQITPVPANESKIGGQFRGQPTPAAQPQTPKPASKPAPTAKPTPRGQPKPTPKPAPKPTPKPAPKPAPKPTPKGGKGGKGGKGNPKGKPTGPKKPTGGRGKPTPAGKPKAPQKGGSSGGKERGTKGFGSSKKGQGLIASAGVTQTGNRRKGSGGKKDRAAKRRIVKRRKGGRSNRGRSR